MLINVAGIVTNTTDRCPTVTEKTRKLFSLNKRVLTESTWWIYCIHIVYQMYIKFYNKLYRLKL